MRSLFAEALRVQNMEHDAGYTNTNTPLVELTTEYESTTLLREASGLRQGGVNERQLYARLLADSDMPARQPFAQVTNALAEESAPAVLQWLMVGLRNAGERAALPELLKLAQHPSPHVRFQVPDALSACAEQFDDVADALLALSRDCDADVRWSAIFELAAWWQDTEDSRVRQRLLDAQADDEVEVRQAAREGLAGS